jgi:hypothetical protein
VSIVIDCEHSLCHDCLTKSWDLCGKRGIDNPEEWDPNDDYLTGCILCNAELCNECGHIIIEK